MSADGPHNISRYRTTLPGSPVLRTQPLILLWTTFAGYHDLRKINFSDVCNLDCTITNDQSLHPLADAVLFKLWDISAWLSFYFAKGTAIKYFFPKYRNPNHVWVLFNDEPVSKFYEHFDAFEGVFNWTASYRRNSDVYIPFGVMKMRDADESVSVTNDKLDYFTSKNESGAGAMITNCIDDARRYRIISQLKRYINVSIFGYCGTKCPDGYDSCIDVIRNYRFYLAFENSHCYDYLTEKYWRALEREQIPIVAWKQNMTELVIPGSYINIYDFASVDDAGLHIQRVNSDPELYNSYFKWRERYKIVHPNPLCDICRKLLDRNVPRTVYHDIRGWLTDDTCEPLSVSRHTLYLHYPLFSVESSGVHLFRQRYCVHKLFSLIALRPWITLSP